MTQVHRELTEFPVPLLGFAAFSGTGKTTLLKTLIPLLREQRLRIAMIKHAHHSFEVDRPGKDSYELRKAGAEQMLIASAQRWALMTEQAERREPRLAELIGHLDDSLCDLVLVEGFKKEPIPKIELHRPSLGHPLLYPDDPHIVAVATDTPEFRAGGLPVLSLNDPGSIARFILDTFSRRAAT